MKSSGRKMAAQNGCEKEDDMGNYIDGKCITK